MDYKVGDLIGVTIIFGSNEPRSIAWYNISEIDTVRNNVIITFISTRYGERKTSINRVIAKKYFDKLIKNDKIILITDEKHKLFVELKYR